MPPSLLHSVRRAARSARLAVALLLAATGGVRPAVAENVTIRLGTILPSGTPQLQTLQALGEEWQKLSGGTVKLTIYPDGRLGGEGEMVKKMRIKQLNACVLTVVGLSEIDPGAAGMQVIPLLFKTWDEVDFVREKLRPLLEQRLRAKGFEVLLWGDAGWVRFFSKEAGVRPDDFKKMKIFTWAGDLRQAEIMKAVGYRPVGLETTDIMLGLNTDMINVVPVPPLVALAGQLYGPAPHMLDLNWSPIVGAAVIRHDVWEKLPADLQAKILESAAIAGTKLRALSREEGENSVRVMQQHGLHVHALTPQAAEEWRQLGAVVQARVRGSMVPEDIFDAIQQYLAEYRQAHAGQP